MEQQEERELFQNLGAIQEGLRYLNLNVSDLKLNSTRAIDELSRTMQTHIADDEKKFRQLYKFMGTVAGAAAILGLLLNQVGVISFRFAG